MIVLVEDRQRRLLKTAESRADRFDREIESGEKMLESPEDVFAVPAVPEPEEWALFGVLSVLLGGLYFRQKRLGLSTKNSLM